MIVPKDLPMTPMAFVTMKTNVMVALTRVTKLVLPPPFALTP